MGKVLSFRGPEEKCANCWYYTSQRKDEKGCAVSSVGYCRHPDRIKGSPLSHPVIERLGLHCNPAQWCPKYVNVDSPEMKKLQFISGIRFVLFNMQQLPKTYSSGVEKSDEYRELVDQFYGENRKLMTISQYKAAKRDVGYFAALVEETAKYYKQKSKHRR